MATSKDKTLFIGLDAADKDLIMSWARSGALPNFKSLLERAAWGEITNPPGLFVGAVWPSFYTGVSPAKHGRYCYAQLRLGTYDTPRFSPAEVAREPFWDALGRAGQRVAIVDVPKTVPSLELNGCQLVDWGTHDPDYGYGSWPAELAADISSKFGYRDYKCDHIAARPDGLRELRDQLLQRIEDKVRLCEHLFAKEQWDLFVTVFADSHCAGHQFWHLHDKDHPSHDASLAAELGDPILDIYKKLDEAVGRLINLAPEETSVFVMASHGMGPHYDATFLLSEILQRLEDATLQPSSRVSRSFYRRAVKHIPAWLRGVLRPLRAHLPDTLGADISRRRCFAVPNNDVYGAVRINRMDREPQGLVRPGVECEKFIRELTSDLMQLTSETGEPIVRRVLRCEEIYEGELLDTLPDLLIEWNRERPITCVKSAKIGEIRGRFQGRRTGDHKADGLLFACGPSIPPGRIDQTVSMMDLAPTLAATLGVKLADLDGNVVERLVPTSTVS